MSKNILIVGASSQIALTTAELLSEKGYNLILASRDSSKIEGFENSSKIDYDPSDASAKIDLPDSLEGLLFAPGSINLKPFQRLKADDFLEDFNINVINAVNAISMALPKLRKAEKSSVVMFSTVAVGLGMPFHASIASAKGAVEGMVRSLAAEFAPKVRFNAVAPSLVDTPLAENLLNNDKKKEMSANNHPLKRYGNSKDIANAAAYLLSEDSDWVTGQIMKVDGGMSALK